MTSGKEAGLPLLVLVRKSGVLVNIAALVGSTEFIRHQLVLSTVRGVEECRLGQATRQGRW